MSTEDLFNQYEILIVNSDMLRFILKNKLKNLEEAKKYIDENYFFSKEEKKIIYDYLEFVEKNSSEKYIEDYVKTKYKELNKSLTLKEKVEDIEKFLEKDILINFQDILSSEEKKELLDNIENIEPILDKSEEVLRVTVSDSELLDYINSDGKNKIIAMEAFLYKCHIKKNVNFYDLFYNLNSEYNKALACFQFNVLPAKMHLKNIKDDYIRSRIIVNGGHYQEFGESRIYKLTRELEKYKEFRAKFKSLSTEKEKTDLICSVDDNDIKICFLKEIKKEENRSAIIGSFENKIEPELSSEVKLVQDMIKEFWEDFLGEQFTDDKKEKMNIVFNRASINFSNMDYCCYGISDGTKDMISLNSILKNKKSIILGCLIHEYGHLFSNFSYKINLDKCGNNLAIEEGTQDLFEELVINHYLEKHGEIKLDGKKIFVQNPYISYSGYNVENGWQRTILYPLQEHGIDKVALAEYLLGDKNKYLELVLGKEIADSKPKDEFGNPFINISYSEIYNAHRDSFENVDHNSIYYRRNWLLPALELQRKLPDMDLLNLDEEEEDYYDCDFIARKYFNGKKVFEIEPEELAKFFEFRVLENKFICDWNRYVENTIYELTEDDINMNSFEILRNESIIWEDLTDVEKNLMHTLGFCFEVEQLKVSKGQSIEESLKKYKCLIPKYLKLLSKSGVIKNTELTDDVRQLQQIYLNQLDEALQLNKEQTVEKIQSLVDSNLWLDEEMVQVLENNGVNVEAIVTTKKGISSKDISRATIKGKITLRETDSEGIALENIQTSERNMNR